MVEHDDGKIGIKNHEGYTDTTPYNAINRRDEHDQRHYRLIKSLVNMIDLAGYQLIDRIQVVDRVSGRIYR